MKEKIKNIIIVMLVAGFTSITVSAATLMKSKDVIYDNKNTGMSATDVQSAVDELYSAATDYSSLASRVSALESNSFLNAHPIGSIYLTISEDENTIEKMHNLYGGTWQVYAEGRTLVGVGTGTDSKGTVKVFNKNETAGEYSHTLTVNEMPSHTHTIPSLNGVTSNNGAHGHVIGMDFLGSEYLMGASAVNDENLTELGFAYSNFNVALRNGTAMAMPDGVHSHDVVIDSSTTGLTGKNNSINNISPYITVYMYKRVN